MIFTVTLVVFKKGFVLYCTLSTAGFNQERKYLNKKKKDLNTRMRPESWKCLIDTSTEWNMYKLEIQR